MRSSLALISVTAGLLAVPGVAAASTVSVDQPGGPAVFRSGSHASDLTVSSALEWSDAAQPLIAGPGCTQGPPITCAAFDQDIRFGAGNDRYRSSTAFAITVSGAGGGDSIRAAGEVNRIDAGSGADQVWENGDGTGYVIGGSGNDKLYSFEAETPVDGGTGDDLLITAANGPAGVSLTGDDGDDELVARSGSGTASGGDDDDVIALADAAGAWTAAGGSGSDTIGGGPFADTVTGGSGNDVIDVSGDGGQDSVDCGTGIDLVIYDPGDTISRSCEIRRVGPVTELPKITRARADAAAFVAAMPSTRAVAF
jgi:Ca2+-binding RTX toxin-like protein